MPRFSEFDERNELVFDAALPAGYNTYRAYRFEWVGEPETPPTATAERTSNGEVVVRAFWNGATEVARWDVLDASGPDLRAIPHPGPWSGLDTAIAVGESVESGRRRGAGSRRARARPVRCELRQPVVRGSKVASTPPSRDGGVGGRAASFSSGRQECTNVKIRY